MTLQVMGALHWGALIPSAVAVCCSIGARRARSLVNVVLSLVMLVAMFDMASGARILWPMAWCALLVALAPVPVAIARFDRTRSPMPIAAHRSLALVATAALITKMPLHSAGDGLSATAAEMHHASVLNPLISGGIELFLVFSGVLLVRVGGTRASGRRRARTSPIRHDGHASRPRIHALEVISMSAAVAIMAVAG